MTAIATVPARHMSACVLNVLAALAALAEIGLGVLIALDADVSASDSSTGAFGFALAAFFAIPGALGLLLAGIGLMALRSTSSVLSMVLGLLAAIIVAGSAWVLIVPNL